jgi:hypothetical protein
MPLRGRTLRSPVRYRKAARFLLAQPSRSARLAPGRILGVAFPITVVLLFPLYQIGAVL